MIYRVNLVTWVPVFANIEVQAHAEIEAWKAAGAKIADREFVRSLSWEHGEGGGNAIRFPLDDRDFDNIEVQDAVVTS